MTHIFESMYRNRNTQRLGINCREDLIPVAGSLPFLNHSLGTKRELGSDHHQSSAELTGL